jgi:hypothetical protein
LPIEIFPQLIEELLMIINDIQTLKSEHVAGPTTAARPDLNSNIPGSNKREQP